MDIDLRWGVTEAEVNNGKAIDICLEEIDGSRPFFVCILGERYGFVPDRLPAEELYRFTGLQAVTHKSITHLEIMHAIDRPLERLKPPPAGKVCPHAFFYFRKAECLPRPGTLAGQLSGPQLKEYEKAFFEPPPKPGDLDRREQLRQLKGEIRQRFEAQGRVFEYEAKFDPTADNPEDDQGPKGRFTELKDFGDRIEADLMRAIENEFAEHIRAANEAVDPLLEEQSQHEAFIENRTQVHVPRADLETQLTDHDFDAANPGAPGLVLSGPPGSGKRAILLRIGQPRSKINRLQIIERQSA